MFGNAWIFDQMEFWNFIHNKSHIYLGLAVVDTCWVVQDPPLSLQDHSGFDTDPTNLTN